MSFNLRNIREISTDPSTKFISHLAKKISDFINEQQTQELENKEDIYSAGQDVDSVLRFHNFTMGKQFTFDVQYFPPYDPDGFFLRLWLQCINMGNSLRDYAETTPRNIILWGDPMLIDGTPFDNGLHTTGPKSLALRFNGPGSTNNDDHINIGETDDLKLATISTGFSLFFRFRIADLSTTVSGISSTTERTLFHKVDDNSVLDAAMIQVKPDGRLVFIIKDAGGTFAKETATSTIAVDTLYDLWITYTSSGNVIKIYINNVDKTLSNYVESIQWETDLTNHNLFIFRRGIASGANGYVEGDLYDFRFYRDKVINATEVSRHYTNKWTISNIPFGQVMVNNYWATYREYTQGYTTEGYDSTGFTT